MNELFSNNITLKKESHRYILSTEPDFDFTSVTSFVGEFFEEFDANKIATKLVASYPKYRDRSVESLITEWDNSANHGTLVHKEIEECIKSGIQPTDPKAIMGYRWLQRYLLKSDFDLYPEVIVYSKELKIAGTIDLLIKDRKTGLYTIIDWKTSKKIETSSFKGKTGINSASKNILDCNYNHYSLQLSLYRYILEEYYGINIQDQIIAHIQEDEVRSYLSIYMKDNISLMLNNKSD